MAVILTPELNALLASKRPLHTAVLVSLELPVAGTLYLTNYHKDLVVDGIEYEAGAMKGIGDIKQKAMFSTYNINVTVSGASNTELNRVLNSKAYMNKRITIARAYIGPEGLPIRALSTSVALPMFDGIIIRAGVSDTSSSNGRGSSTITWTCSSKFSDFKIVNGRQTNDEEHRGLVLDTDGVTLVPSDATKKPEYQLDKGFQYASTTVAFLASYQVSETKYSTTTTKGGFAWR